METLAVLGIFGVLAWFASSPSKGTSKPANNQLPPKQGVPQNFPFPIPGIPGQNGTPFPQNFPQNIPQNFPQNIPNSTDPGDIAGKLLTGLDSGMEIYSATNATYDSKLQYNKDLGIITGTVRRGQDFDRYDIALKEPGIPIILTTLRQGIVKTFQHLFVEVGTIDNAKKFALATLNFSNGNIKQQKVANNKFKFINGLGQFIQINAFDGAVTGQSTGLTDLTAMLWSANGSIPANENPMTGWTILCGLLERNNVACLEK